MNRVDLRKFLMAIFCGCGQPEAALTSLARILERLATDRRAYDGIPGCEPNSGVEMLLLYWLDRLELTEHGGSVSGSWLTAKGEALRAALQAEEGDGFAALLAMHCAHGVDVDDPGHDCMAADRAERPAELGVVTMLAEGER